MVVLVIRLSRDRGLVDLQSSFGLGVMIPTSSNNNYNLNLSYLLCDVCEVYVKNQFRRISKYEALALLLLPDRPG